MAGDIFRPHNTKKSHGKGYWKIKEKPTGFVNFNLTK